MGVLLVVSVSVIVVLALVVHFGRGLWARARSVERHQQALDTLAEITTPPGGPAGASDLGPAHQAHVRVIGPRGEDLADHGAALSPPRSFGRSQAIPARLGSLATPISPPSPPGLPQATPGLASPAPGLASPTPAELLPGQPSEEPTDPGFTPPPPVSNEPPTRPVPVVQAHVFYFDDLTTAGPAGKHVKQEGWGASGSADGATGLLAPGKGPKPRTFRALVAAGAAVVVAALALALAVTHLDNRRSAALSTPTAPVATAPVATTPVATAPKKTLPKSHLKAATRTTRPANRALVSHKDKARLTGPTTTLVRAATSAARPAVLLSSGNGTATYQLTAASAAIVVKASGPCWIEVKAGSPLGQIVYEGTLETGQQARVTGPAWIRLGDPPYAEVMVDGKDMNVPGRANGVPLNVEFTLG